MTTAFKITKQTNEGGFYLRADGTPSIYNKSGYTPRDIQSLNMEAKETKAGTSVQ